jgi:hypothetical protein
MMERFESPRCRAASIPEYDSMDGSTARGTGNGVCDCRCEDTGNGVCGRRDRRAVSLRRDVVSLRGEWTICAPVATSIAPVEALYGSWHWKQGVSGPQSVALQSRGLLGIWSGNVGGESA